jgi:membrane-associated phospholipid phosphatase
MLPERSAAGHMRIRASEWLLIAYFCYTALLSQLLPVPSPIPLLVPAVNSGIVACFFLLAYAGSLRGREFLGSIRDWYPFPLMLLTYREMGWFAQPHAGYALELRWVEWDRAVLRGGLSAAIESLGPVIPALLEISYTLVYTLGPFSVAMLYAYHKRERAGRFLFVFILGVLLCYVQFPFWPSEPPRTVFPGEDFPGYDTAFRRFNHWLLGGYGIHTSVFPSAHVAGAFAAAFGMWAVLPEHRWVARVLLVMALMIATATVYGRYHYLADAAAGLVMALAAAATGALRRSRLQVEKRSLLV